MLSTEERKVEVIGSVGEKPYVLFVDLFIDLETLLAQKSRRGLKSNHIGSKTVFNIAKCVVNYLFKKQINSLKGQNQLSEATKEGYKVITVGQKLFKSVQKCSKKPKTVQKISVVAIAYSWSFI